MHNRTLLTSACALGAVGLIAFAARMPAQADAAPQRLPAPALDMPAAEAGTQTAVLSGGCFWGVQGVFEHVKGVTLATSGYAGGARESADYETVSTGGTGHAETVQVRFDPRQISYGRILQIFFSVALDPTQKDHQGPDWGSQYRSEIWTADAGQDRVARAYIAQLDAAHAFAQPIATRVDPLPGFYPAEGYHQDFLVRNPAYPYIAALDMPKVEALQRLFPQDYRADPVTTGRAQPAS